MINEGLANFEWPSTSDEIQRIKRNTRMYANSDIRDAFSDYYNLKLKKPKKGSTENLYQDVKPGECIPLRILNVDKKNVTFDTGNYKEDIVSAVNLYQYKRFKSNIPKETIMCKVVSKDNNKIVVDPLAPMFDSWLKEKIDGIKTQYNVKQDKSIVVSNLRVVRTTMFRGGVSTTVSGGFTGDVRVDTVSDFCGQDIMLKAFIPGSQIVLNIERDFESWEGREVRAFISNYVERQDRFGRPQMSLVCSAKEYLKFQGDIAKMRIFDAYCLNGPEWKEVLNTVWNGTVTGIINSSKKQGVFVEIPNINITGLIEMKSSQLNHYKPGDELEVMLDRIDEPMYLNTSIGQRQHVPAFVMDGDILQKCNLRFVLKLKE